MEFLEHMKIECAKRKPSLWLWYTNDTFAIWYHGVEDLKSFLYHLNNMRTYIKFNMEMKFSVSNPFLDVLVTKKGAAFVTTVYRKSTQYWLLSSV
jgi:hypothetical protein